MIASVSTPVRSAALLIAVVSVLAVVGAAIAVASLIGVWPGSQDVARLEPAPTWKAVTSIGPLEVLSVERSTGSSHTAGHADDADVSDEVGVAVEVVNRRDVAVAYSPGQFRLALVGTTTTISPVQPNPPPAVIAAGETISQELSFVVPVRRSRLALVFDDLGATEPLLIELGSLPSPNASSAGDDRRPGSERE